MIEPKTICTGCRRALVPKGTRCEKCQAKGKRGDQAYEKRRGSFRDRGYSAAWSKLSEEYRNQNPLCVPCLARGIVQPATCVDHIIPAACCIELMLDTDNLQGACTRCNSQKRFSDPTEPWVPDHSRIVVCGLPGTGKTTFAKTLGCPIWDTDDHPELTTIEQVQKARAQWIAALNSSAPCVVIVGSTITAPHVAYQLRGIVKHLTEQHVTRPPHPLWGQA